MSLRWTCEIPVRCYPVSGRTRGGSSLRSRPPADPISPGSEISLTCRRGRWRSSAAIAVSRTPLRFGNDGRGFAGAGSVAGCSRRRRSVVVNGPLAWRPSLPAVWCAGTPSRLRVGAAGFVPPPVGNGPGANGTDNRRDDRRDDSVAVGMRRPSEWHVMTRTVTQYESLVQ